MLHIDKDLDRWDKSSIQKGDISIPAPFTQRAQSGIFKIRTEEQTRETQLFDRQKYYSKSIEGNVTKPRSRPASCREMPSRK